MDESFEQGLRREVLEETGMTIEIGHLTGVYKNIPRGIIALVFLCRATSQHKISTAEATEIGWWSVAAVPQIMNEAFAVRLTDAIRASESQEAILRVHDGNDIL